jgi:hypothetical protein
MDNICGMFVIDVVCSDPDCAEELEIFAEEIEEAESVACECGHCTITLAVAGFEPVYARSA